MEVPELPRLRAVNRAADDRHLLLHRDHRRARLHDSGHARALPRPLDEDAEAAALADDLAHPPHRLTIRLAAADRERVELADELAEPGDPVRLRLRDEGGIARVRDREERDVDPGKVVERDDETALARDAIPTVDPNARHDPGEVPERRAAEDPRDVFVRHAAARSRTSASISSTTSSTVLCVVSISLASGAGCIRSASCVSRARRSVASASAPMPGRSAVRRRARSARSATRYTLTSAFGATTVPMSRPSITTFPSRPSSRWRSRITSRTPGCAATTGTMRSIRCSRIDAVTSVPAMKTRLSSPKTTGSARASVASAFPSPSSIPRCIASHVSARYIAPVSR